MSRAVYAMTPRMSLPKLKGHFELKAAEHLIAWCLKQVVPSCNDLYYCTTFTEEETGDIICLRLYRKYAVGPRIGLRYLNSVPRFLCLNHNACFYFLSINAMSNENAARANRESVALC